MCRTLHIFIHALADGSAFGVVPPPPSLMVYGHPYHEGYSILPTAMRAGTDRYEPGSAQGLELNPKCRFPLLLPSISTTRSEWAGDCSAERKETGAIQYSQNRSSGSSNGLLRADWREDDVL